jgi:penicillin G amidase
MRRWIARIGLGLTLLLVLAAFGIWLALAASLPRYAGTIATAGLGRPVRILRDANAIPHVEAASEADAYQAMGYLHGQDRLWQMEFDRLAGQGRLAEVLGEAALPVDRYLRTLGLAARAEADLATQSPADLALLEAYARGVNAAIAGYGIALPPEFLLLRHRPEPWRPVDCLRLQKLLALTLSGNWRQELLRARLAQRLRPDQLADLWPGEEPAGPITMAAALDGLPLDALAAALPPAPPAGLGSNVWVAAGSRTASRQPLLANDPHLPLQLPGQWYLVQIEVPGLSVIGATLPGLPFVVLGRNRELAWGFSTTGSDTQDLFIEQVDPADPGRYRTPDGSEPFTIRREQIAVRGGAPVPLEIRTTRHGPVVSDLAAATAGVAGAGRVLALAWTQLQGQDTTVSAGFGLGRARNLAEFVAAAERYTGAEQNMAFAARDGTIGMISPGLVPIRRQGDGRLPVPGWSGDFDWVGTIPADRLPRVVDPPGGLLVNANNRLVDGSYHYFLTADWEPPLRARRIVELLGSRRDLDADAMAAVQLDVTSALASRFLPYLPLPESVAPNRRELLEALRAWDGRAMAGQPEPLAFAAWYDELGRAIAGDELGPALADLGTGKALFLGRVLEQRQVWCDVNGTTPVETCAERSAAAFATAMTALEGRYGEDWHSWRWGDAHPAVLAHRPFEAQPLLRRWFSRLLPVGGDDSTVDVAHAGRTRDELPFGVVHAAGYRAIYDLAAPDGSRWIAATGQSGHPLSRHYADLAGSWQQGRYLMMTTDPGANAAGALGVLELQPVAPMPPSM